MSVIWIYLFMSIFPKEDILAHINIISNFDLPFEIFESERKIQNIVWRGKGENPACENIDGGS